jgi:hypothetical protein
MYIESIDIEGGTPIVVGEVCSIDDGGDYQGIFTIYSIGIHPNCERGDIEIRVTIEVPIMRGGMEVGADFVELDVSACEW